MMMDYEDAVKILNRVYMKPLWIKWLFKLWYRKDIDIATAIVDKQVRMSNEAVGDWI